MKFFVLLFNIYLVFLSGLPCGDKKECDLGTKVQLSMATHQEHGHTDEACTPFCNCSCCAASVVCQQAIGYDFSLLPFSSVKFPGETASLSHGFKAIWQPPKIG